jgi:hypothetical protein
VYEGGAEPEPARRGWVSLALTAPAHAGSEQAAPCVRAAQVAVSDAALQTLFALLDTDESGSLDYGELCRAMRHVMRLQRGDDRGEWQSQAQPTHFLELASLSVGKFSARARSGSAARAGTPTGRDNPASRMEAVGEVR